ncbi:unnamed protein product [Pedinophyceae sp. YPF-701]|nr:unnamed protein product [Pedinophyceae sp. YPF-701]
MGCAGSKDQGVGAKAIKDNFSTFKGVQEALRSAGLEGSNLLLAIDFTASNQLAGKKTFDDRSLHDPGNPPNPYKESIMAIANTLSSFDEDGKVHVYGFGDARTHASDCFSFNANDAPCHSLEEVLTRYTQVLPRLDLSGPTSFAPVIYEACKVVERSGHGYHILVIIADGGITGSGIASGGPLSPNERDTIDAIIAASNLPLSIVMIGVGDGPWDTMNKLDDKVKGRKFDNFQFVDFSKSKQKYPNDETRSLANFAKKALQEIPHQYKIVTSLGYVGATNKPSVVPPQWREKRPLNPPDYDGPDVPPPAPGGAPGYPPATGASAYPAVGGAANPYPAVNPPAANPYPTVQN